MTTEEAIKTLESRASTGRLEENYSDFGFGASIYTANEALDMAIAALRAQRAAEKGCEQCSGIVYRQSCSGKIVPLEQRCGAKIMPPCYRRPQAQNDPLTLDELQEMDGDPVWVVWPNRGIRGQWFVVGSYDWRRMEDDNMILDSRYSKRNAWNAWIAFRHKPKEV